MLFRKSWVPNDYVFGKLPLSIYDERESRFLKHEEDKLQNHRNLFRIDYCSIALRKANKEQSVHTSMREGRQLNIWLNENAYQELRRSDALLNHALSRVLNYQHNRIGLREVPRTGYDELDAIINDYRSFQDALKHRSTFGKQSQATYANTCVNEAQRTINQATNPTTEHLRQLRNSYIHARMSREYNNTNQGIQTNAQFLFSTFIKLTQQDINPTTKLHFLEYLADLQRNAISLHRSYQENTLKAPQKQPITSFREPPSELEELASETEDYVLRLLTSTQLNA